MKDSIVVANIAMQGNCRASVSFPEIKIRSNLHGNDERAPIAFYKIGDSNVDCKAIRKCKLAASLLAELLNPTPSGKSHVEGIAWADRERASVAVSNQAIVAGEKFTEGRELYDDYYNIFISMRFRFPSTSIQRELNSAQNLQTSSSSLKSAGILFDQRGASVYDSIHIISGVCLFNDNIWKGSLADGVCPFVLKAAPTIQELERIARSSTAIADVAAVVVLRLRERSSKVKIGICLDIPSFHYYYGVLERFESDDCTSSNALAWMDAVDMRHDQFTQIYTGLVQTELAQRGVLVQEYHVRVSSRSNYASRLIRQTLENGENPRFADALQGLENERDGTWRSFYQYIPAQGRPKNWKDLGFLFYVFEAVRSALLRNSASPVTEHTGTSRDPVTIKPRRLIVGIDDPSERRIYSEAQVVLRKIRSSASGTTHPVLVPMFLCKMIFFDSNKRKSNLFYDDPMPIVPFLAPPLGQEKKGNCPVEPLDIVRWLYGDRIAKRLQQLLAKAGL